MEVWDFVLIKNYLISGTSDSELRVFKLTYDPNKTVLEPGMKKLKVQDDPDESEDEVRFCAPLYVRSTFYAPYFKYAPLICAPLLVIFTF